MPIGRSYSPLPILFLALAFLFAKDLYAQGGDRQDGAQVQELDEAQRGTIADPLPRSIDLRPWLPTVGRQTMNDCVAWAFGYAGRTYLEAVDQGWRPDHPDRIFSPTFIYNQINKGVDNGSLLPDALNLLSDAGAATLGTAPYLPKDFQTQPSASALEEAQHFRILDYDLVSDVESIKHALAESGIVLVCARVNPEFMSGSFELYNREVHDRGSVARRPDQPHGYHAMAIVGYNDDRQALLFMNSWGLDWGQDGFLWVSYDLLDEFNYGKDMENLLEFAVVMRDRKEPVTMVDGKYQVVDSETMQVGVFAQFADVDEEGRQRFRYTATLRAPQGILQEVKQVRWSAPTLNGTTEIVTGADGAHRVTAMSLDPNIQVQAWVDLGSSEEVEIRGDAVVEAGESVRRLQMRRHVAFQDRDSEKKPIYRASYLPQMSDADWRALTEIRYEYPEGYGLTPPAAYTHDGGLPPSWSMEESAYLNITIYEPVAGFANLSFRDGSTYSLPLPAEAFDVPTPYHPYVKTDWRLEGRDGDRSWYYYQIEVFYPEAWTELIDAATVSFGDGVEFQVTTARLTDGPQAKRFVYQGYTDIPIDAHGTLSFYEDHPEFGYTYTAPTSERIAIETDASWVDLFPDPEQLFNDGDSMTLRAESVYLAETAVGPLYRYDLYLGGTASVWFINQVTWTIPQGTIFCDNDDDDNPGAETGYAISLVAGSEPFDVSAHLLDAYGREYTLKKTVTPHARRSNALSIDLEQYDVADLWREAPNRHISEVRLLGSEAKKASVTSMEAVLPRAWGGVRRLQLLSELQADEPTMLETLDDRSITFFLHHDDGAVTTLHSTPHVRGPHPVAPRLQMEIRDRAMGQVLGKPVWNVEAILTGDLEVLREIQEVRWTLKDQAGQTIAVESSADIDTATYNARTQTSMEGSWSATVVFQELSGRESMTLEGFMHLQSPQQALGVSLQWGTRFVEAIDSPMVEMGYEEEDLSYVVTLQASLLFLQEWDSIRWTKRDLEAEEALGPEEAEPRQITKKLTEYPTGIPTLEVSTYAHYSVPVRATLIAENGTTLELGEILVGEQEEVLRRSRAERPVVLEPRLWSLMDGSPTYLLASNLGTHLLDSQFLSVEYGFSGQVEAAGGGPQRTHAGPLAAREFLVEDLSMLRDLRVQYWARNSRTVKNKEVDVETTFSVEGLASAPRGIETRQPPEGGFHYFLQVPESELVQFDFVKYAVEQDGVVRQFDVHDRIGATSDAFELRLTGPKPTKMEAQPYRDGQALGAPIQAD